MPAAGDGNVGFKAIYDKYESITASSYASVLPVPLLAYAITLLPRRVRGNVRNCKGLGRVKSKAERAENIFGDKFKSANVGDDSDADNRTSAVRGCVGDVHEVNGKEGNGSESDTSA